MYEQIASNKRRTVVLIIIFIAVIIGLGYIFSRLFAFGPVGVIGAGAFAFIMTFGSYYYGDKIVLKASRARPLEHNEYPYLDNTIEGLAISDGIPKPKAYIIDDMAANAFATGRNPENAVIAVTRGLVEKMDRQELEGVIAHEMSHIKNFDIRLMAIVSVLVGMIILLADWFRYSMWFGGISDDDNGLGGAAVIIGLVLAILAPIFAMLIQFAVSRRREYLADASGAMLTRYPDGLASALKKLATDTKQLKAASNATAHLFIINPFKKGFAVSNFFSTHPPIEERVKRLEEM